MTPEKLKELKQESERRYPDGQNANKISREAWLSAMIECEEKMEAMQKSLAFEHSENIRLTAENRKYRKALNGTGPDLAAVLEENRKLREALLPLANLDLTGVTAEIIYARNKTLIKVKDVEAAKQLLK